MKKTIDHTAFKEAWFTFEEILHIEAGLNCEVFYTDIEVREHMRQYISSHSQQHAQHSL